MPGACSARADSPWSGPFPPPSPPAGFSPALVRRSLRYPWACPTSHDRSSPSCSFRIHGASPRAISQGQAWDLPVPVQRVSMRARGLRPRRARPSLALAGRTVLPSAFDDTVGTLKLNLLSRLNARPALPPVNASPAPLRSPAHDAGSMWLAGPSSYGTFIHYSLPVLPAHHHLGLFKLPKIGRYPYLSFFSFPFQAISENRRVFSFLP